jgi:hypothetical protein
MGAFRGNSKNQEHDLGENLGQTKRHTHSGVYRVAPATKIPDWAVIIIRFNLQEDGDNLTIAIKGKYIFKNKLF